MNYVLKEFLIVAAAVLALVAVAIAAITGVEAYQCGAYQRVTGKPTRYAAMSCYVQDQGTWYVWEEYKNRLITKGEMK